MSNETLILKTAVATNSTVKLTDCPMASGEILEMVCRLYANGLTSGNRCFKAIGNAVTYNTDAVTEGDIYCVSYRDGGFYIGLRTTEDYEPKEGDWWCYNIILSNWACDTNFLNKDLVFNSYGLAYSVRYNSIVDNFITQSAIQSTRGNWSKLMTNETPKRYIVVQNRNGLFVDFTSKTPWTEDVLVAGNFSLGAKDDLDVNRLPRLAMLWKPISNSDILSYQNTGKMGGIILGEELEVTGNKLTTSKSFVYNNNEEVAVFCFDEDGNPINVTMGNNKLGPKGTIFTISTDPEGKTARSNIYAIALYGYMYIYKYDYATYFENDNPHRLTMEHSNAAIEYPYTIRAFKVIKNNMTNV